MTDINMNQVDLAASTETTEAQESSHWGTTDAVSKANFTTIVTIGESDEPTIAIQGKQVNGPDAVTVTVVSACAYHITDAEGLGTGPITICSDGEPVVMGEEYAELASIDLSTAGIPTGQWVAVVEATLESAEV